MRGDMHCVLSFRNPPDRRGGARRPDMNNDASRSNIRCCTIVQVRSRRNLPANGRFATGVGTEWRTRHEWKSNNTIRQESVLWGGYSIQALTGLGEPIPHVYPLGESGQFIRIG